ncbi:MAG: hypothetical protein ACP5QD_01545 [Candidatus Ratteibacteria bacterium]
MEKREAFQSVSLKWKEFDRFDENNLINLTRLGYKKNSEFSVPNGRWQVFCLEKKTETGIGPEQNKEKIITFFAIFTSDLGEKKFPVSGMCDNLDEVITALKYLSYFIFTDGTKRFLSRKLTIENAQDYGYIRGLIAGIILMLIDVTPWHIGNFRPQGVLSTFLEYTRIVYYGTPGFAIVVGMAAIGIYFTILFILLPILAGNFYLFKARKKQQNQILLMPECLIDFEYGKDAESFLSEQLISRIDSLKRDEIYRKVSRLWRNFKKEDCLELYEIFRSGFLTPEALYNLLNKITRDCPEFDVKQFLEIMIDVMKRDTEVVIKVSDKSQEET